MQIGYIFKILKKKYCYERPTQITGIAFSELKPGKKKVITVY